MYHCQGDSDVSAIPVPESTIFHHPYGPYTSTSDLPLALFGSLFSTWHLGRQVPSSSRTSVTNHERAAI